MGLREVAAMDRTMMLTEPMGVGELLRAIPPGAAAIEFRGLLLRQPTDSRNLHGVGVASTFGLAELHVSAGQLPGLTRAWTFFCLADSTTWVIEDLQPMAGVGWRVILGQPAPSQVRGVTR